MSSDNNSINNKEYNDLKHIADINIDGENIESATGDFLNTGFETIVEPHSIALRVEGIPGKVYAGVNMPVTVSILCNNGCEANGCNLGGYDMTGSVVRILGSENEELCSAIINSIEDGGTARIDDKSSNSNEALIDDKSTDGLLVAFMLEAPKVPGAYTWRAVFEAAEGCLHNCSETEFSFEVKGHEIILLAWGMPSPVNKGGEFNLSIGARCAAGCSLSGLPITIRDEEGNLIANANLGDEILTNTAGTYWVGQTLTAPCDEGVYTWVVNCDKPEFELEHKIEKAEFTFRTVAPPEYNVTVNILKKYDGVKIDGANVMLGFHKGMTNENGSVVLYVPGGEQILRASHMDYVPYCEPHVIEGDCEITIELEFNPAT